MRIIVRPRRAGKTHELLEWVKQGERTDSYPGWSRIILTHTLDEAQRLRTREDMYYHQVFSIGEWQSARIGRWVPEIAIDNADIVLADLLGRPVDLITMTGEIE